MKNLCLSNVLVLCRGESSAAATSKMECLVIIVNGWKQRFTDVFRGYRNVTLD